MIIYACADLIFATKVRSTAESLGIGTRPTRDEAALAKRLDQVDDGKLNEPVAGLLVDLDLGEAGLALIRQCKSHGTSPVVVAFGAHVNTAILQGASDSGADFVMPRGSFTANLPDILTRLDQGDAVGE